MTKKASYKGELTVTTTDRNGNVFIYETPNIITFDAAWMSAHVLVGDIWYAATYLAIGTGNTAAARTDEHLENEIWHGPFTEISFPYPGQVQLDVILDYEHPVNGSVLREVGLLAADESTLFARQVHSAVTKDSNQKLGYRWRVVFT